MRRGVMPSVWALRGVVAAGLLLALLAGIPEGYVPSIFVVVLVVIGVLVSATRPEQLALSITMGIVVVWWALHLHSAMPVGALVAAAALIAAHVAATLLGYGPPTLALDPQLGLLWATRAALTWTAALAVWVVARTYSGHGSPTLFWLAGLTAAVVGAVVAAVAAPIRGKESR
jgi:hypothetical protein